VASASDEKVQKTVIRTRVVSRGSPRYYVHKRSTKNSVAIIGGSTLGGAGIGALVGGKKGALIGGLVGGTAGTVYDRKTRKRVKRVE
jgi:outer membrane lipoprotein SlyB